MSFKTAPEGKFKSRRGTRVARSCLEAWRHRAKMCPQLSNTAQVALVCHLARPNRATWHGRAT